MKTKKGCKRSPSRKDLELKFLENTGLLFNKKELTKKWTKTEKEKLIQVTLHLLDDKKVRKKRMNVAELFI